MTVKLGVGPHVVNETAYSTESLLGVARVPGS
jgi:hypothetical protein